MRKILAIFGSLFLFLTSVSGQLPLGYTEGIIIKKNGDTIKCFVEFAMGYEVNVKYKLEEGGYVQTISTKQIQSINTSYQNYENIFIGKKEKIMALMVKGAANLYKFVLFNDNLGPPGTITLFGKPNVDYVIKKDGILYEVKEKGFKTSLAEILGNCSRVVQKINNNAYKFEELESAIKDYNNCNKSDIEIINEVKLIGKWESDMSDELTNKSIGKAEMTFTNDEKIIYDIIEAGEIQRMTLTYRVTGDSIISKQLSLSQEEITRYKFEGNDKLILEINGIRSVFLRKRNNNSQ